MTSLYAVHRQLGSFWPHTLTKPDKHHVCPLFYIPFPTKTYIPYLAESQAAADSNHPGCSIHSGN